MGNPENNGMSEPRLDLSVIMPCYNVDAYIHEALASLVAAEVGLREVIVVDDGSEDDTVSRVLEFESVLPIRLFRQKNQGAGQARNRGVLESSGEYLYFFDSDDRVTNNFLRDISELIESNCRPDVIAFSGQAFADGDYGHSLKLDYQRHVGVGGAAGEAALKAMVYSNCFYAQPCLYVVKKAHWLGASCSFPDGINEDEDVIVPMFLKAESVIVSRHIYFERRLRSGSTMTALKNLRHIHGREKNIRISLAQLSTIASNKRDIRKILRKRCEMFANAYMDLAEDLGVRPKLILLVRVAWRRRNRVLARRVRQQIWRTLGGKLNAW